LPLGAVDNRLAWAVTFTPILLGVFEAATHIRVLGLVYLAFNIGLTLWDERRLKAAGYEAPNSFLCYVVPGYLWQRAVLLEQPKFQAVIWTVGFVGGLFLLPN
jgi:hypothetical protein